MATNRSNDFMVMLFSIWIEGGKRENGEKTDEGREGGREEGSGGGGEREMDDGGREDKWGRCSRTCQCSLKQIGGLPQDSYSTGNIHYTS